MLILGLAGNTGVAAYGVVANTSLVAVALFNGIAQGSQPLISESYSKGNHKNVTTYLKMAVTTTIGVAVLLVVCIYLYAPAITAVFNGEGNQVLASYAENGLRLYFIGFLFAGMNIVGTAILSSIESAKYAFLRPSHADLLQSSFCIRAVCTAWIKWCMARFSCCGVCYDVDYVVWAGEGDTKIISLLQKGAVKKNSPEKKKDQEFIMNSRSFFLL